MPNSASAKGTGFAQGASFAENKTAGSVLAAERSGSSSVIQMSPSGVSSKLWEYTINLRRGEGD